MLRFYRVNLPGPSHLRKNLPCQDSFHIESLGDAVIAAVADGLGTESHSDVGSRVAARVSVSYCAEHLAACTGPEDVEPMMRDAYYAAHDAVIAEASRMSEPIGQFDTTLCLAIFNGDQLFWGQSGDSGLIACFEDGTYRQLTTMQRDDQGRVFPLCFDDHWAFGSAEQVSTLLLCTDGILENFAPRALARHADEPLETRLLHQFLHPQPGDGAHVEELQVEAEQYWRDYPSLLLDDDKTMVVVFDDEEFPAKQPPAYYEGPDWKAVGEKIDLALRAHESGGEAPGDSAAALGSDASSSGAATSDGDASPDGR